MSASNKTGILGLNLWEATDRPKRSDFVNDNTIIEDMLGTHIQNNNIHLSEEQKTKLDQPNYIYQYVGNDSQSRDITLPFEPSLVIIFKKGEPVMAYNSTGYSVVNYACATQAGDGGGCSLSGTTLTVSQSTQAADGVFYNFNKQYAQYIAVLFR